LSKTISIDAPLRTVSPTYRIDQDFEWNFANGPFFEGPFPDVPVVPKKDFFGLAVNSRFGIAASLLPNARWMELYAKLGFDLLTYKTVRLAPRRAYSTPTWLFLDEARTALLEDAAVPQSTIAGIPTRPSEATVAGSIGVPSQPPEFWEADIARCRDLLRPGQALIVSVVASVTPESTTQSVLAEFEELARRVRVAGAQVVEANLSCPNVQKREGEAYRDPALAADIARALRRGCQHLPLLLKVGSIEDKDAMRALLRAVDGIADGVIMMNGLSRIVHDPTGNPAFGPNRVRAGITGGAIYRFALRQVRDAVDIVENDRLAIKVLGCGGATTPERVRSFLDAGACAVLSATAVVWNPFLAIDVKHADRTV
jgi:dihydroorotate dehydrogenase